MSVSMTASRLIAQPRTQMSCMSGAEDDGAADSEERLHNKYVVSNPNTPTSTSGLPT